MIQILLDNLYLIVTIGMAFLFFMSAVYFLTLSSLNNTRQHIIVLILSIGVFISLSLSFYNFIIDDAYISLRYARNFANGYGLVFSTDGSFPVEGYTNFLWVIIEAALFFFKLPDDIILHAIKIISIAFGVGIIIILFLLVRLVTQNERVALFSALFLSAIPHLSFWAVGGLETTMYIFWMLAGVYVYISEIRKGKGHTWSIVLLTLMAFTRPEGLLFILVVFLCEILSIILNIPKGETLQRIRNIALSLLIFGALYGVYFLWRYNFYGFPLPNSFYAKQSHSPFHLIGRLNEMSPFLVYLLPLIAVGWYGYFHIFKHNRIENLLLAILFLALVAFGFLPKTEWMPGFRYELPFVPILLLFFATGIYQMIFKNEVTLKRESKSVTPHVGALLLLGVFLFYPIIGLQAEKKKFAVLHKGVSLGKWLKQYAPKGSSYASWDMGVIPYYSEFPTIIEINPEGLLSTYITHKGYNVDYFLSQNPSFIVLPTQFPSNRKNKMFTFYSNDKFKTDYEFIFSLNVTPEYILNVYKNRHTLLTPKALEEARYLSNQSYSDSISK